MTNNLNTYPSNQFAAVTSGSIIKCEHTDEVTKQDMLLKAQQYALNFFSRPNAFYYDVGMLFVSQNGDKFECIGPHEVMDEANVCFIKLYRGDGLNVYNFTA
jgi:hypothetical protein